MHNSLLRYRVPLGFLFAAWYLIVARPSSGNAFLLSAAFVALGCLLRSWAAGFLFKGKRVAVGGPYAYIRNPLYVGSFVIGVGFCIALWRQPVPVSALLLWILFIAGFGFIYRAKTLAEEKELTVNLGQPYQAYAARVPPFSSHSRAHSRSGTPAVQLGTLSTKPGISVSPRQCGDLGDPGGETLSWDLTCRFVPACWFFFSHLFLRPLQMSMSPLPR